MPVHVARNTMPRMKRLFWYPYDEATNATFRGLAELYSAPGARNKMRALGKVLKSAGKSIKNKV